MRRRAPWTGCRRGRTSDDDPDLLDVLPAESVNVLGSARQDNLSAARGPGELDVGFEAAVLCGFPERDLEPAVRHVVRERQHRGRLPDVADQRRLRGEVELARRSRQQDDVVLTPGGRDEPHVRDEPDAPDDRRRRDRVAVGVVVEGNVPGHDGNRQGLSRLRNPFDRLLQLPRDFGLLGRTEVQAVRERQRLAARTRDVSSSAEDGEDAGDERIVFSGRRTLE